jgi:hypothetical protein
MRTTLNLDDDLMRSIEQHAASSGRTLTSLVEESLREFLIRAESSGGCYTLDWVPVDGGAQPGVDLTDFAHFPGLRVISVDESPADV